VEEQHKSHLVSTYTTLLQHVAEIRQVVTEGKTPAGARVTPLPPPQREHLLGILDELASEIRGLVEALLPEWKTASKATGGLAATRMWTNVLLGTIEELLEDIGPDRMGKRYGKLKDADAETIRRRVETALERVREAMEVVGGKDN
jgi:hypothetical protein